MKKFIFYLLVAILFDLLLVFLIFCFIDLGIGNIGSIFGKIICIILFFALMLYIGRSALFLLGSILEDITRNEYE